MQGLVDSVPVPRLQRALAIITICVALCGVASIAGGLIDFSGWRAIVCGTVLAGCVPLTVAVLRSNLDISWWNPRTVLGVPVPVLYVVFSDIAETIFLLTFRNRFFALFGTVLMALTSAYVVQVGRRSAAVAHVVVSSAAVIGIGLAAWARGDESLAVIVPLVMVTLLVVIGPVPAVSRFTREIHEFVRTHYELSSRDPLTGLLNRRGLVLDFAALLTQPGDHVIAVVADLDHFKRVNDDHGHQVGDAVIRLFASRLEKIAGFDGIAARIGGEEFCAVFVTNDADMVKKLAERLLVVSNNADDEVPVTVSVGVAALPFDAEAHPEVALRAVIHRADHALYLAKSAGRNRVVAVD